MTYDFVRLNANTPCVCNTKRQAASIRVHLNNPHAIRSEWIGPFLSPSFANASPFRGLKTIRSTVCSAHATSLPHSIIFFSPFTIDNHALRGLASKIRTDKYLHKVTPFIFKARLLPSFADVLFSHLSLP